ncbi:NAD(P)/FAD-dependent oxidoreductase [Gordonia rubripertincta]|uniref:FAD-dependent oxidoreductase n=1 Tax=Gordonia rubripertincta TaxID=36822 RepID=A0ABT4MRI7_GORRU|nr:FAD-dependent oxidoreductase [Gordonia rubripertincta]MCZ4548911.1 FAD-dependent oxidoreductase [Gordonia rubripertincta]
MNSSDVPSLATGGAAPYGSRVVVVGASHAAVAVADRLRAGGHHGPLTLIGSERHSPYHRPPLSKAFLKGEVDMHGIALRGEGYFRDNDINLRSGERVVEVERRADGRGVVRTRASRGREIVDGPSISATYEFDRLVLATGARPRRLSIPGADHRDVLVLRDLEDALRLKKRLRSGPVVVVGGGFVGLEVAATMKDLGGDCTVVEVGPGLMGRAVGSETAAWFAAEHMSKGIDIELGRRPEQIVTENDRIVGVRLDDDRLIPAATVVVGVGVIPRDELARTMGLRCAATGGVIVDHRCVTSDGVTIAIGDCTVQPHPTSGAAEFVRLESVDNCDEQAVLAADTLLGDVSSERSVPWFWSDQGATKLQMAGVIGDHDEVVVRMDPKRADRRAVIYLRSGTMIAVECINSPADFLVLRKALARRVAITREALADVSTPLRKLLDVS